MSINLPRAPAAEGDPERWAREMERWGNAVVSELERYVREAEAPAKDVFAVTNNSAATTTLDVSAAALADLRNFVGGLYDALRGKGILRSKAGAE